ncbi:MarR family winged helix-turn-helix transcriptional regulator [Glaciecola sp. 1036]|uniref:MarR family winged helix-turn-helix transcriptional regulator n=1 Tax=Alteromonadaceae TaxID=72275 RepID=UPI003D08ED1F
MTDVLKLENQLCHRFYILSNAFTRAYRPLLKALDITYPQYVIMMALWEHDDITIAQLLNKTMIDGGAMSLILKKLEIKGFIHIRGDHKDKRVKRVLLTKQGKEAKQEARFVPEQMLCKLKGMTVEEGKQLISLIDKLQNCFENN